MTPKVHILATVRRAELLPAATFVFRTLRVGFPTAEVCVWGNNLATDHARILHALTHALGGQFVNLPTVMHDRFIEQLVFNETRTVWLCDTDVAFWRAVEDWRFDCLAGRFEPAWFEPWTETNHVARLHTCLMYLDPIRLRTAMRAWTGRFPQPFGATAEYPMIRQHFLPVRGCVPTFYDSTSGLWNAGIGTPFSEEQNAAFDHLNCGTYSDLLKACPDLRTLGDAHAAIFAQTSLAFGLRAAQARFYENHPPRHGLPVSDYSPENRTSNDED